MPPPLARFPLCSMALTRSSEKHASPLVLAQGDFDSMTANYTLDLDIIDTWHVPTSEAATVLPLPAVRKLKFLMRD